MINEDRLIAAAEELDTCILDSLPEAQEHTFSQKFLNKMSRLVFKTDHPITYTVIHWVIISLLFAVIIGGFCLLLFACGKECEHDFITEIRSEANCMEEGVKTNTCQLCHTSNTEPIPTEGHSYDDGIVTLDATCSVQGVRTYTCSVCGDVKTEVIATLPHRFGPQELTKEATCAQEGEVSVSCTVCGAQKVVEKTPKSDTHTYENHTLRSPTCLDRGEGQNVCTLCGHSVPCDYELTAHAFKDAVVTKKATCTTPGEKAYTCSVCDYVKTEAVSKKEHTWNTAGCTTAASCTVCGAKGKVKGHNYVCTTQFPISYNSLGYKTGKCSRCGDTKTQYFGAYGTYDLEAVKNTGVSAAKKLGFITDPCPGHGTYSKITREPTVPVIERNGGQDALEEMLLSMIDELDSRCAGNSNYYAEVVVKLLNPYGLGDGSYFRLEVFYHLCTKGD